MPNSIHPPASSRQVPAPDATHAPFVPWALALFFGHVLSNIFLVNDLYLGGLTVDGEVMPSPLSLLHFGQFELWGLFVLSSALTVLATVKIASIKANVSPGIFFCVPVVIVPYMLGASLRNFRWASQIFARFYLFFGAVLVGLGIGFFLSASLPYSENSQWPFLCSMSLQLGLALIVIVGLNFARTTSLPSQPSNL